MFNFSRLYGTVKSLSLCRSCQFFYFFNVCPRSLSLCRSQEVFRQAMRSPAVRLEVLPIVNKERFEKSLIGHLFSIDSHDGTPQVKEPPPLKVKPVVRPVESSVRQAGPQESSSANNHSLGSTFPISFYPRGKSSSPLLKKSHTVSPLVGFTTKKGGKRFKIDLKKGT